MTTSEFTVPERITVRVLKYDGSEYRRWEATLAEKDDSLIVLDAEFADEVRHHLLGNISRGTRTIEYYWLDRWYNIFRFLEPDGSTQLFYCNLGTPPAIHGGVLSYIDLVKNMGVQPDWSFQVLDLEEFDANAARFGYPEPVKARTHQTL